MQKSGEVKEQDTPSASFCATIVVGVGVGVEAGVVVPESLLTNPINPSHAEDTNEGTGIVVTLCVPPPVLTVIVLCLGVGVGVGFLVGAGDTYKLLPLSPRQSSG